MSLPGDDQPVRDETSGSATFTVTGAIHLSGTLTNVLCIEANPGNYVAQGTADTASGTVTVGAELPSPQGDQQEGNSLKVGDTVYNRISMGSKLLTGHRDGEKLTVTAKLVNSRDPFNPDLIDHHDQWRTVTMTTHWDCGGQLAKWDRAEDRLSALGAIDGTAPADASPARSATTTRTTTSAATSTSPSTTAPPAPPQTIRLPAPQAGDHSLQLTGAVTKTLTLSTVVCTGDVLTAAAPDGSSVTIGIGGRAGAMLMVHLAGSPDVWRAGEHADSAGTQASSVDYPLTGAVTPYSSGVALAGVRLAHADTAMAAPDPSTTAIATGSLACTVGTLTLT